MARFILDIKTESKEEFANVMQELKLILPTRTTRISLIDVNNNFNEDNKLNILTDAQVEAFNIGICRILD
jgi:hypothetical protein